ncbi:unnamed protein product [Nezara viridula]|uniref:Translin-associated protein X n=1 Tax=Nezara viridula TaxID=85310 RepID=A0A9P0HKY7_NEZVI|nr:unnamed protein product [Nezara viridula]
MKQRGYEEKKRKYQKPPQEKKALQYDKTPVTEAFEKYAMELNSKQDKSERIVKLSRDVTIASKRAIFSLHALMRSGNYEEDLAKITETLETVRESLLKNIAFELAGDDPYQFCRNYTAGLQEYIEAVTFYHFITKGGLFNIDVIQNELTFEKKVMDQGEPPQEKVPLLVSFFDYILGVQDLTGEVMRHCINSFSARNLEAGNKDCNFVKSLYTGMLLLNSYRNMHGMQGRDFMKKMSVTLQSLKKMEMACYAAHIRGSEALDFGFNTEEFESYNFGD